MGLLNMFSDKNIYWVDNAKAIGISLIVLGHTHSLKGFPNNFIYSFHVPLFFFLAGFLLKDKYLELPFLLYVKRYFQRLGFPYFVFGFISYLFWLPTVSMRSRAEEYATFSLFDPILGLIYGSSNKLYINEPLWFFTCLFSTLLIMYFIKRINNLTKELFIVIICAVLGYTIQNIINFRLPWNMDIATTAVVFLWTGHIASKLELLNIFNKKTNLLFSLLVLAIASTIIVKNNGYVTLDRMYFNNIFLYFVGAFSGIGIILAISKLLPKNTISYWLSLNTIIIFPLHKITFNIFEGIGVIVFKLDLGFKSDLLFAAFFTTGALLVCIPASLIIHKYFPWIIGKIPLQAISYDK